MKKIDYKELNETLYHKVLENGLEVYILPKKGFSKTYGLFATRFGSIDQVLQLPNGASYHIKDGSAHFLEHKMFEKKDYQVFDLFSQYGASCNAFTSTDKTAYLFSTVDHVNENLNILLDFVQSIELTEEAVEREKGIIIQEMKMYEDDPDTQLFYRNLRNMYHHHSVAIDILGTEASVNAITKSDLENAYQHYYHPSNMTLFVIGNIDPEKVMTVIENNQSNKIFKDAKRIKRHFIDEPNHIVKSEDVYYLDITIPKYMMGFKMIAPIENRLRHELMMQLFLSTLFSRSSDVFEEMFEKGLINRSFQAEYSQEANYAFIQIASDTKQPEALDQYLKELLSNVSKSLFNEDIFESNKKQLMARMITLLNSVEQTASLFISYLFENQDLFSVSQIIQTISFEEVYELRHQLDFERMSTLTIYPKS